MVVLFYGCENKKADKKKIENTGINVSDNEVNTITAASSQPEMSRLKVTTVIAEDSLKQKKSRIKVTFIELGSVRCIPCKMMMPIMKEVEEKYGDEVKVIFYDVWTDAGRPYAEKYQIRAIPTQVFLDENGKEFFRHVGFFPREELFEVLKKKGVNIK
jgi:thioredoxin 1